MRRFKIISKTRFTLFIMMLIAVMGFALYSTVFAAEWDGINIARKPVKTTYTTVTVHTGDTLWSIASRYTEKHQDIRQVVSQIRHVNALKSTSALVAGQSLRVPVKNVGSVSGDGGENA